MINEFHVFSTSNYYFSNPIIEIFFKMPYRESEISFKV